MASKITVLIAGSVAALLGTCLASAETVIKAVMLTVDHGYMIYDTLFALDASVQAQVISLLADLRARLGLTILFVTHDLRVAAQICDRIAVMRSGKIVELSETAEVFRAPRHAYTRELIDAAPGRRWRD